MKLYSSIVLSALLTACATQTRSLVLGGTGGVALGAYTGSAVYAGPKNQIKTRNTLLGTGIGLTMGLLTAYLLDQDGRRRMRSLKMQSDQRLHFGDLPPNPFTPAPVFELPQTKFGGGK